MDNDNIALSFEKMGKEPFCAILCRLVSYIMQCFIPNADYRYRPI